MRRYRTDDNLTIVATSRRGVEDKFAKAKSSRSGAEKRRLQERYDFPVKTLQLTTDWEKASP
jgi:hypothetical protein